MDTKEMNMNGEHGKKHHHDLVGDMAGCGHWGHIVIKILVALFIFWAGVQFGELKAMVRGAYFSAPGNAAPYGMMDNWR